jgi:hypothetical protein
MSEGPVEGTQVTAEASGSLMQTAVEQATEPVTFQLTGGRTLSECEVLACADDAVMVKNDTGTYLFPWHVIQYVHLESNPEHAKRVQAAYRALNRPRRVTWGF